MCEIGRRKEMKIFLNDGEETAWKCMCGVCVGGGGGVRGGEEEQENIEDKMWKPRGREQCD